MRSLWPRCPSGCRDSNNTQATGIADGPSAKYAQQCSSVNPYRNDIGGTSAGSLTVEKQWMRAFFDENYLFYTEVPNVDPSQAAYSNETSTGYYGSIQAYFNALRTPAKTASGALEDKFSFTYPTLAYNQLSQSGVVTGYGVDYAHYKNSSPNRDWEIFMVEANSPAGDGGAATGRRPADRRWRGFRLRQRRGHADARVRHPGRRGQAECRAHPGRQHSHTFTYNRPGTGTISVTMTSANVTNTPVPIAKVLTTSDNQKVGYILFNSHTAASEKPLRDAITSFQSQGINDLVLGRPLQRRGLYLRR